MLQQFIKYNTEKGLLAEKDRILVAISGGKDSVVLLDLLHGMGLELVLAHMNFQLRGADSDGDEAFVVELAKRYGYPCVTQKVDTHQAVKELKCSVEMAARELRYRWFEAVAMEKHCTKIATAHHLNDTLETVLLNLTRGTGITGMHGIAPRRGKIIRPLGFATRLEIDFYAQQKSLNWREDATNGQIIYQRNRLRLEVIPALKKINPGLEYTMQKNIERIRGLEDWFMGQVEAYRQQTIEHKAHEVVFKLNGLPKAQEQAQLILSELLRPFGFRYEEMEAMLQAESGKQFYTSTHRLVKDRERLILVPLGGERPVQVEIGEGQEEVSFGDGELYLSYGSETPAVFTPDPTVVWLDANKLTFPLKLRPWEKGDWFCPLGMGGRSKKISDLLVDLKLSIPEKEKVWVLTNATGEILWVVGYRMDERAKLILSQELQNQEKAERNVVKVSVVSP